MARLVWILPTTHGQLVRQKLKREHAEQRGEQASTRDLNSEVDRAGVEVSQTVGNHNGECISGLHLF